MGIDSRGPDASQRQYLRLGEGEPGVRQTSTNASTSSATWASVCLGVGVMRKRSVPISTVGQLIG